MRSTLAGNYSFALDYVENGNPPAAVQWMYPSGAAVTPAPEPSALLMLASGMAALGFWRKRITCR